MTPAAEREPVAETANPLGMEGLEFVEYVTPKPQALGQLLGMLGFHQVARHRSREVTLYRQGGLNVVVNAHEATLLERPAIAAVAFRVRDAARAYERAIELGAWAIPTHVEVMELNIPAVHGVGHSRIYFVDRWREFSIYDVDFVPVPGAPARPEPLCGLHLFGLVQYIGAFRLADWTEFYRQLFGFTLLPQDCHFGVLTQGRILRSACGSFYLQLIEAPVDALESSDGEELHRLALGTPDVLAAVEALRQRGLEFVDTPSLHPTPDGALTSGLAQGPAFELVRSLPPLLRPTADSVGPRA